MSLKRKKFKIEVTESVKVQVCDLCGFEAAGPDNVSLTSAKEFNEWQRANWSTLNYGVTSPGWIAYLAEHTGQGADVIGEPYIRNACPTCAEGMRKTFSQARGVKQEQARPAPAGGWAKYAGDE